MVSDNSCFFSMLLSEQAYRENSINLNASENFSSPLVGSIQGTHAIRDNYHFSAPSCLQPDHEEEDIKHWAFAELSMPSQLRLEIENCFEELLGTNRIDPRPKGGQAAEIATLLGLGRRGDTVFVVHEDDGGHFGLRAMAERVGIHLEPVAFDHSTHLLDVEETVRRIRESQGGSIRSRSAGGRVVAVQLSQSYILREQPLHALALRIRDEFPDITLALDISHTMLLHMGGQLSQPLACDFDIIHGNTHKTFPGPQKAIIAFSPKVDVETIRQVAENVCPILQSNCGTAEIIALGIAALEMRIHAREYAQKIVENAKSLSIGLAEQGFCVIGEAFGFTQTHQVWMLGAGKHSMEDDFKRLVACGFRANPAILPFTGGRWGFRMGTQGLTRRGMEPDDMREIARLIKRALLDREDIERLRCDAFALTARFPLSDLRFRLSPAEEKLLGGFSNLNDIKAKE